MPNHVFEIIITTVSVHHHDFGVGHRVQGPEIPDAGKPESICDLLGLLGLPEF